MKAVADSLWKQVREDFPILAREVHGRPLVYLDNAATSLTPRPVLAAMNHYYEHANANVHRGLHTLSAEASEAFEQARDKVQRFIGARGRESVVFTRGATSALNLAARAWARPRLARGDVILVSELEHHANLVSWHIITKETGAKLRFIPLADDGTWRIDLLPELLQGPVKMVSVAHVSNVLGGINPVKEVIAQAHAVGAKVMIDAAQSVGHMPMDFQALDADFLAFSGHKMCGPTGIGVLCGKAELLDDMEPVEGGGDMIVHVGWEESTWNLLPYKFEAGTPPIAEAIGLGAACEFLGGIGLDRVRAHTQELTELAARTLDGMDGVHVYGPLVGRLGPVAFAVDGVHPHDVATLLDGEGIAVRAGHHCAQPLHTKLGASATARASFYITNQPEDVDRLVAGLQVVQEVFGVR
ncbi:MAG: cysteine desulfurase [Armatimonadetes bacterium]|nr:cysteine desulfurase [Armatimonadota bacterium]